MVGLAYCVVGAGAELYMSHTLRCVVLQVMVWFPAQFAELRRICLKECGGDAAFCASLSRCHRSATPHTDDIYCSFSFIHEVQLQRLQGQAAPILYQRYCESSGRPIDLVRRMKLQSMLSKSSTMHWSVVSAGDSFAWTSVNYFYSLCCQSTKYHC